MSWDSLKNISGRLKFDENKTGHPLSTHGQTDIDIRIHVTREIKLC